MVSFAIAFVIVMGFVGLGIDGSAIFAKRQQVQNGADAAAFALAQEYAASGCPGTIPKGPGSKAFEYASANVINDTGTTQVEEAECVGNAIRVRASAEQPPFFMSFIGVDPMRVPADAEVEWGSPTSGRITFPISFSTCEFENQVAAGIIELNTTKDSTTYGTTACAYSTSWPTSGNNFPGGFGFLLSASGGCTPLVTVDGWVRSNSGNSVGGMGCSFPALPFTALIPLFDDCKTGSTAAAAACRKDTSLPSNEDWYHISKYAAFEIRGYDFNAGVKAGLSCSKKPCVRGQFVKYVDIGEDFELGPVTPGGNVVIVRLKS